MPGMLGPSLRTARLSSADTTAKANSNVVVYPGQQYMDPDTFISESETR